MYLKFEHRLLIKAELEKLPIEVLQAINESAPYHGTSLRNMCYTAHCQSTDSKANLIEILIPRLMELGFLRKYAELFGKSHERM